MKLLFLADLHAHNHAQFAKTLPGGRNSRFQNILDVLADVRAYAEEHEVDHVIMLGDVFHARTKIDADVYSATWMAFKAISEVCGLTILVGNHDQYSKDGRIHSLEAFRAFARVIDQPVIDKFTIWDPDERGSYVIHRESIVFAAHPFTTNIAEWHAFVKMVPKDAQFFFFHQGITDATVGAFDISVKAEVDVNDFPPVPWSVGGHYHKAQELRGGAIRFLGSPLQHNMGEREDGTKGWWTYDTQTRKWMHVESFAPQFFYVVVGDEVEEGWDTKLKQMGERDFLRVSCSQEAAERVAAAVPSAQIEIHKAPVYAEKRIEEDVVGNDAKLLSTYVEQTKHGLDQERLLKMGMEMLLGGLG
jgi:DNA repair exonuclease SbcCD nuclease subunit